MPRRFNLVTCAAAGSRVGRKLRLLIGSLVVVVLVGAVLVAGESAEGRASADFTVTVVVRGSGDGFVRGPGGFAAQLRCGIGTARTARDVCSQTIPEESVPYRLVAVPADDGSVEGEWKGCDLLEPHPAGNTCVIIEARNVTVTATINVLSAPVPTPNEKKALNQLAITLDASADKSWALAGVAGLLAGGAGVVFGLAPPTAPVTIPLGGGFTGIAIAVFFKGIDEKDEAAKAAQLALDPPDPRYKRLAAVRPRRIARIKTTRMVSPKLAVALTRMRVEGARLEATLDALLHSVERGQGAAEAKDSLWVARHRVEAARHARSAAAVLGRMAPLRASVARALGDMRVTPRQTRLAQAWIRRNGLPDRLRRELRAAGYAPAAISEFARLVRNARPPSKPLSARGVLADARLRASERSVAAALRRFAARAARTP